MHTSLRPCVVQETPTNPHRKFLFAPWLVLVVAALASSPAGQARADEHGPAVAPALQAAIDGDHRAAENKARDVYRHPAETLTWLGVEPDMTVVEIWPSRGWYTEILAPYLRDNGKLYLAGFDRTSDRDYVKKTLKILDDKLAAAPEVYGTPVMTELSPPDKVEVAPAGSADMVLTFRNVHNWMTAGTADAVFAAMYAALKPGGVLGLVEHRGDPDVEQDPQAESGYVTEAATIRMAEKAGFALVDSTEINANPKDTRDHPSGVWTLPPVLRLGDQDREKYLAIGESDRMTLKFRKPAE